MLIMTGLHSVELELQATQLLLLCGPPLQNVSSLSCMFPHLSQNCILLLLIINMLQVFV